MSRGRLGLLVFLLACGAGPPAGLPGGDGGRLSGAAVAAPVPAVPGASPTGGTAAASDLSGYRTALDLGANRIHAATHRDGRLVIDAGSLDFLKYVDGGWKTSWILDEKDQGQPAALVSNIASVFFFPLDVDGDGAGGSGRLGDTLLSMTARALAGKQRVSIFVNEKPAATLDVDTQTKRYDVTVPAALVKPGDNRVRLQFRTAGTSASGKRSAAAVRSFVVGPASAGPPQGSLAVTPAARQNLDLGGSPRRALVPGTGAAAAKSGRLSFYLQIPEAARLALAVGAKSPGASWLVRLAVDGQPVRTLQQGQVTDRWTEALLDLGSAARQAARIDLIWRGGEIAWGEPRIVVKAPPAPAAAVLHKFDRIYVWMVDTLRADKVHAYNPKTRVETPNYDAFAKDATRFEWAQVPGTWSLPSHASLLTGVYPMVHKATAHEARLSAAVPFIAEDMRKAGYKTGLFSSNGYVSSKWGFDRGWDMSRNFIRESLPNGAEYLWKTAKAWVTATVKKPQFVYLATVEPHVIYNPRKEFLVRYWNKPYHGPIKPNLSGLQLGLIKNGKLKVNDNDKAYLESLHDAEITQSDAAFKIFIDDLKAANLYDSSAIIVISDHGDEFYEHGGVGHGHSVYQELVHVPLIIRAPGLMPAGRVVRADVEAMDLYPTMLELAGLKPPSTAGGASLVALSQDEVGHSPRAALTVDGAIARGLKVARYRLVQGGKMELFDEVDDRLEQHNVAADRPIALRQMRSVFGLLHANEIRWNKARWGTAANLTAEFEKDNPF